MIGRQVGYLQGRSITTVEPAYNDIGLYYTSSITSVPVNYSLLTTTLLSSFITISVYTTPRL